MIVAIDESGSFAPESPTINFFVAVHLRQRRTLYELQSRQFLAWERSLPSSAKNPRGEIKSALLSDDDLLTFARSIIYTLPAAGITPYSVRGSDNPPAVVDKHRAVALIGALEGVKLYESQANVHWCDVGMSEDHIEELAEDIGREVTPEIRRALAAAWRPERLQ